MDFVETLLKRQKMLHDEKLKELHLNKVFHEEYAIVGSMEKVDRIKRDIVRTEEEKEQLDFIISILNEGELKRIYSIYKKPKKGEKITQ